MMVWWCFCGGGLWRWCFVVVFLWRCFCGGVFEVFVWWCLCGGGVFVVVWWCFCGGVFLVVFVWWCFLWWCGGVFVVVGWCFCGGGCGGGVFFLLGWACEWLIVVVDLRPANVERPAYVELAAIFLFVWTYLTWMLDHTSMSTSSMSWSSMTGSCASISLTWFTWLDVFLEWRDLPYLTWLICLELFDFTFALLPRLLFLACISTFQEWSVIGNRHVERHHLGVTRNALRENRLVIFGLCSIGLRRHGPFISCHIFLPLCFALSGTHLGSSFFKWCLTFRASWRCYTFAACYIYIYVYMFRNHWIMVDHGAVTEKPPFAVPGTHATLHWVVAALLTGGRINESHAASNPRVVPVLHCWKNNTHDTHTLYSI